MDAPSERRLREAPVVVVGGGLAGFAAAARLRAAGCAVRVLERGERFGGRAVLGPDGAFPGPLHIGAHDLHWQRLVDASGLPARAPVPLQLVQATPGEAPQRIDAADWTGRMRLPGIRMIDGLRTHRLNRLLRRFASILVPDDPDRGVRLDDRCVRDFVRLYFGPSSLEAWAEPWLGDAMLGDPDETSRLAFMRLCAAGAAPVLPGVGVSALAEALAGADDVTGCSVEAVEPKGDGALVHLASGGSDGEDAIVAAGVILATPAGVVPALAGNWLTAAEQSFYATVETLPTVTVEATVERAPFPQPTRVRVPGTLGSPFAVVQQGRDGRLQALLTPAWAQRIAGQDDARIAATCSGAFEAILPSVQGRITDVSATTVASAFPAFRVGAYRALAQLGHVERDRLACGRALLTAGDWQIGPSIEAACAAGTRAADRWLHG